jgi:RHS repeat-associated protein
MTDLTDPRNILYLHNGYDSSNRVSTQTLGDGVSTYQFSYNPGCTSNCSTITETEVTDPNGNIEKVTFNTPPILTSGATTGGIPSSITYASGTSVAQKFSYQYQSATNLKTDITDALGRTTAFAYDSFGNTTSITRLSGTSNATTTSFTYDPTFNQLTSVIDPLGHATSFSYDSNGNLASVADLLGTISTFKNNSSGQIISVADVLGDATSFNYDGADLTSVIDPLKRTTTLLFDAAGRLMSRTDGAGNRTKYSYNALNQVTQITDAQSGITSFDYDGNGNLITLTDANTHTIYYNYDKMDRVSTRQDALGRPESNNYDSDSNLILFTDRRGKVASYNYDALNRRTFAGFGRSGSSYESTITYAYDLGSRLTQAVDSITGLTSRYYDGLDRLTTEASPQGSVSYDYDGAGRRTSMNAANQATVYYSYDIANRLLQIVQGTATVSFTYDSVNRRTSLTLPNGVTVNYSYDSASQLTGINYTLGTNTLGNLTYSYDLAGRRTNMGGTFAQIGLPQALSGLQYDKANELVQWGTTTPVYDSNGNTLTDGVNSYTWSARNQLASMNSGADTFAYDPFGRRVAKTVLGSTTNYLYDGVNPVQELSGTTPTANLLTGGVDEYFQRTDSSGPANFLSDALGSTLALTGPSGNTLAQYTYEPFGNTTPSGSSANPYQYTGRENDGTGVYFYRNRYYSPTLQRFMSEDPTGVAGGVNFYAYVGNNPVSFVDPFGLDKNAPNNETPWYKTCSAKAIGGGLLSIGIDAIGLIPEAEGFTKVFENEAGYQLARAVGNSAGYRGVVATQYGMSAVSQFKGGAAVIGGAFGLGDTSVEGRISTGLTVAGFIPGLGTAAAAGSIGVDAYITAKAVWQCP